MSSEWPVVRLGDYCLKIGSGATPRGGKNVYLELGDTALIRSQNIYNEGFKDEGVVYITQAAADKLSNVEVQEKDILINITGDSVARTCLAPSEYLPARVNQHVAIIRPDPEEFDARFLRYFLVSPTQQELLLTIASAGATRNALTKGHLESLEVCKPRLKEQKAIAWQLEKLDNKIQLNHQINQTLEQMAQAIFKSWFVDFEPVKAKIAALEAGGSEDDALLAAMQAIAGSALFATDAADADAPTQLARLQAEHPEQYATLRATAELFPSAMQESELGKIPEGWEETGFSDWVAIKRGRSITRAKVVPGDVPVVAGGLEPAYYHNEYNVIGPVITISASGANAGYVNLYHQNIWSSDSSHISKKSTPYFYTAYVCLKYYQKAIFDMQTGAAQPHVYPKDFERLRIVVGDDKLLKRLESLLSIYFEKSAALKKEIISLAELRDTLLPKLLSGELSVSAAADQITQAEEAVNVQS